MHGNRADSKKFVTRASCHSQCVCLSVCHMLFPLRRGVVAAAVIFSYYTCVCVKVCDAD